MATMMDFVGVLPDREEMARDYWKARRSGEGWAYIIMDSSWPKDEKWRVTDLWVQVTLRGDGTVSVERGQMGVVITKYDIPLECLLEELPGTSFAELYDFIEANA